MSSYDWMAGVEAKEREDYEEYKAFERAEERRKERAWEEFKEWERVEDMRRERQLEQLLKYGERR